MLAISWYRLFSGLLLPLGAIAVFVLFFGIRLAIRRKGFGWLSFVPTLIPAIPTAFVAYGIVRHRILYGPCLPEDGCMDEASGPMVLGIIATLVVFAICLGFELLVVFARKRRIHPTSDGGNSESPAKTTFMSDRTTAGGILAVVFLGAVIAFLVPWIVHFGIMRLADRLILLYGFWNAATRIAVCGLLAVGYVFIERSRMPKTGCAVLLAGILSTIVTTLWIVTEAAMISIATTVVVAIALIVVFRRPRVTYLTALAVSILVSLLFMFI